jgi:hypothetical protein
LSMLQTKSISFWSQSSSRWMGPGAEVPMLTLFWWRQGQEAPRAQVWELEEELARPQPPTLNHKILSDWTRAPSYTQPHPQMQDSECQPNGLFSTRRWALLLDKFQPPLPPTHTHTQSMAVPVSPHFPTNSDMNLTNGHFWV